MGTTYLIDTHVAVWLVDRGAFGSTASREALTDSGNTVVLSAVSAYELALKHWLGKMPEAAPILDSWSALMRAASIGLLAVTAEHGLAAGRLDWEHRDPFDRMLVGQAQVEGVTLVTADRMMLRAPGIDVLAW